MSLTARDERHLKTLYKPFAAQVRRWMERCHSEGLEVRLSQSFRFYGEQSVLYQQGKSRANGGESKHNFCLAVDFVFDSDKDKEGIQNPYLEPFDGAWKKAAELAEEEGMIAGYFWEHQDRPHIEAKTKATCKELHKIFIKGDMPALFKYLDENEKLI